MFNKIVFFLLKKKVAGATGEMQQVSKTKLFMCIEALLQAVEFAAPYFGKNIHIPEQVHLILYSLAGIAYRDSKNTEKIEPAK